MSEDVFNLLAIRGPTRGEVMPGIEPGSSDPKPSPLPLCHRGGQEEEEVSLRIEKKNIRSKERGRNSSGFYDWYGLFLFFFFHSEGNLFFSTKTLWHKLGFMPELSHSWFDCCGQCLRPKDHPKVASFPVSTLTLAQPRHLVVRLAFGWG